MGDRYDREREARRKRNGQVMPPEPILTWGIGDVSTIGHNGGPPLDEEPGYLWRKYRWTKAYKEAWKTPSMSVLKFRVARAEAAGLTYHEYMLELLDSGRHLQKEDVEKKRRNVPAKPTALGGSAPNAAGARRTNPDAPGVSQSRVSQPSANAPNAGGPSRKAVPLALGPSGYVPRNRK